MKLHDSGVYLVHGTKLVAENDPTLAQELGPDVSKDSARQGTIAYRILKDHNQSGNMEDLSIRFDKLTSHDITFVGIIQTARASGLTKFPIPYVLTNCHNSLCAVGGTINEDDHMFGLTCAKKYGGVYVPPHQAVIHQFAREMLAGGGKMILGSDSHTRYGALGTMAIGEGGPELVKQLLSKTYDIKMPGVVGVYLTGTLAPGVGPQDVAIALIGAVFEKGYVKNKVMEFVGPGVAGLSVDTRIGIDVMTTETTCLSSIWQTDEKVREFYHIHGREADYAALSPADIAYYDGMIELDLSEIKPMIAMPFHPSNAYTIEELNRNLLDILDDCEKRAAVSFNGAAKIDLKSKVRNGKLYVDQGIIAGCAGGGFENMCDAADILNGASIGSDEFTLSVYPASMPIYMELVKNGAAAKLMETGAVLKTAFCGPCFGAGDTPANNGFSIRHSTRNFPNREGSKIQNGQIASVALMDARSIAATAANKGVLTAATDMDVHFTKPQYFFDQKIYQKIASRYSLIVPEKDGVGTIYEIAPKKTVVLTSTRNMVLSHSMITWQIEGSSLIPADRVRYETDLNRKAILQFLNETTAKQREVFVKELFDCFDEAGVHTVSQLSSGGLPLLMRMLKEMSEMDSEAKGIAMKMFLSYSSNLQRDFSDQLSKKTSGIRSKASAATDSVSQIVEEYNPFSRRRRHEPAETGEKTE